MLTIGEPKSSSGNGMSGRIYLHEFGSTAKWSISPTAGGDDGETYSISLPVEDGTVLVQTDLGEAHLYDSTGLANSTKIPTGADVIGYLGRVNVKWGPNNYFFVKNAYENWTTKLTLKSFTNTSLGILLCSNNLFTIWRSGSGTGAFSYYKIGGNSNITISGALSGDNLVITASTNCTLCAMWLSNNQW